MCVGVCLWAGVTRGRGKLSHAVKLVVGDDQVVDEEEEERLLFRT